MPLPFILWCLWGAAAGLTGAGVVNGMAAMGTMEDVKKIGRDAQRKAKSGESMQESARVRANASLEELGREKLDILGTNMKDFVHSFSQLRNVDFRDSVGLEELQDFEPGSEVIGHLEKASLEAVDFVQGLVRVLWLERRRPSEPTVPSEPLRRHRPVRPSGRFRGRPQRMRRWHGWAAARSRLAVSA